jgi:hypothetical protein
VYISREPISQKYCFEEGFDEALRLAGEVDLDCSAWYYGGVGTGFWDGRSRGSNAACEQAG